MTIRTHPPTPQTACVVNALLVSHFPPTEPEPVPSYSAHHAAVELTAVTFGESSGFVRVSVGEISGRTDDLPSYPVISDAALFQLLVLQWHKERGATSSITQMAMCPAYQRIIGMGPKAIPLILQQLENNLADPDHWFWALQALTGQDPVPPDARGDMSAMAHAWLEWAYLAGYEW